MPKTFEMKSAADGGLGPYNADDFEALDIAEYRKRCPATSAMSDEQLFHAVSNMEDDMDDADLPAYFGV